ncbi:uncharacterized protein F5891DRAFT_1199923 [Suillus fuscotomentosus]|uniref:Uncharacterized protein n=1 Tax=Suillus fuscotomentosus TaxID=1912939 RepID=A0AAD4DP27_9AGAM|nr:uncharacterized protein F5891DRAFT_1199923 [Suillus fuscotomentosus]KAG1887459.1 hypothetical protein F5891DRAFT_1199923 [Suillus fuscotomentosus]
MSLPVSTGSSKKKAKSNVVQQVDQFWGEIESLQSDAMLCHDSKHQRFLTKLEVSQAALNHQRQQKNKELEIRLHKVDIRVHEAHSQVLNKKAETLCKGGRALALDGAA